MWRWREGLAGLGVHTPAGRDAFAAAVLVVLGVARIPFFFWVAPGAPASPPALLVAANLAASADLATIAVRRRAPRTALALALGVVLASALLPARYPFTGVGLLVCAYTVPTLLSRRSAVFALALAAIAHAVGGLAVTRAGGSLAQIATYWGVPGSDVPDVITATLATFGIAGFIGVYTRTRRAYTAELVARAEQLEAEREERARKAVAQERGRIARELHDIAAHDLSAIVVQAGAADRLVDHDADAAKAVLRGIRSQGRDTLSALRQLVGIMRDDDADGRAPQPTLLRLEELVAHGRAAGMVVEVTTRGRPSPLPAAVDLAAYRVVQEGLTNARRHAPGSIVSITISYEDGVRVVVRNTAPTERPPPTSGDVHGLLGMRERVQHSGGTLSVGPTQDGGWRVEARLPDQPPDQP